MHLNLSLFEKYWVNICKKVKIKYLQPGFRAVRGRIGGISIQTLDHDPFTRRLTCLLKERSHLIYCMLIIGICFISFYLQTT